MIETMIFDLDGTLVQTEKLKAESYAQAAVELRPELDEHEVRDAFKDVIGRSRQEVAEALLARFGLEDGARDRMAEFGVAAPWEAFSRIRLAIYERMIQDPDVIRDNQWPHNRRLLEQARRDCRQVALATMSHRDRVTRILEVLELEEAFDHVATRDDVAHGKPDPEIYQHVARELGVAPESCLVIEDSPSGVQAALNAGMAVIAVATPFSRDQLRAMEELDPGWLVEDADKLPDAVQRRLDAAKS